MTPEGCSDALAEYNKDKNFSVKAIPCKIICLVHYCFHVTNVSL